MENEDKELSFDVVKLPERLAELFGDDTQEMIAAEFGVDRSSVSNWLKGKNRPNKQQIRNIAKRRNVNMYWILGADVSKEYQPLPEDMIEPVRIYKNGDVVGYTAALKTDKYVMAIVVCDASMATIGILPDSIAFIRAEEPSDGALAAVTIDDGPYLIRRIYRNKRKYELRCDNPMIPAQIFENQKRFNIIGTVGAVQFEVR